MRRGLFIVFEGLDRSGKSSQKALLAEQLKAREIAFPNWESTESGKLLDKYLNNKNEFEICDEAVHLLFSMNRWEVKQSIQSTIKAGRNVVADRYAFSGVAYSAAKGLDFDWCKNADKGLLRPDIVFYLNVAVADTAKRSHFGAERYEKEEFQA